MNDDTGRDVEQEVPTDRIPGAGSLEHPSEGKDTNGLEDTLFERGMPELGQYGGSRPRAWWIAPLAITAVVIMGGVWTVHGFLARHDAAARARRDATLDKPAPGRIFADEPGSSARVPARAVYPTNPTSAPQMHSTPASAVAVTRLPQNFETHENTRSYYDAPLLESSADGGKGGETLRGTQSGISAPGAASVPSEPENELVPALSHGQAQGQSALSQALTPTSTPRARAEQRGNRSLMLAQGAKIDCVGDTAFDSSEAGISTCTVTRNVYSDDGRVVLIERGSQINSEYRSNPSPGQTRVFVLAARIRTPNGVTVEIDSPAADALGRMGVGGYVNNHWGERIGAAMMLGLSQDAIGYLATRGGNGNGSVVFENTQQQGNDLATRVLDRTINIAPTLTQNQGAEFTIVVARDLDFSGVYALQTESVQ